MKTTLRELVTREMEYHEDSWENLVSLCPKQVDQHIDNMDLPPFTVWTRDRVYFPVVSGWVGSAARHPDGCRTEAQG